MSAISEYFLSIGEPYASGLFEESDASYQRRFCRAERRFWENREPLPYGGEKLYPCGLNSTPYKVLPHYSNTYTVDIGGLPETARNYLYTIPQHHYVSPIHAVNGNGFIHSQPYYARIALEGLDSYQTRIDNISDPDFKVEMTDVIEGIRSFHSRSLEYLISVGADSELIAALKKVPFKPADTLYEAIVCWNFVYYLDGCDNPGLLATDLYRWYKGEDVTGLLHRLFLNVDINNGWTGALGPDYNPLVYQCLKASHGMRRPSFELRVSEDMPDDLWELAGESIMSGSGNPTLYNEALYQSSLQKRFPDKSPDDLKRFCGGGCTETMLAGISNVGSLDAGINSVYVFRGFMADKLSNCESFDDFYNGFMAELKNATLTTLDEVSLLQKERAECRSLPMRTLLVDDCIDNESDFLFRGARHYWSVINIAGMINVIDSMLAIRDLVYERKIIDRTALVGLLDSDDEAIYHLIKTCPAYGRGDETADALGQKFLSELFETFKERTPYLGGAFLPSSIQFVGYVWAGVGIGATPDGRHAGDPLCDSVNSIHANDTNGITALLSSVASMPFHDAVGTPVMNLKLSKEHVKEHLRPLVETFFKLGGMQLQITCQSRADMLDAIEHPENHPNLIVRVGGYAEYFNRLPIEYQKAVIERTEY